MGRGGFWGLVRRGWKGLEIGHDITQRSLLENGKVETNLVTMFPQSMVLGGQRVRMGYF